MTFEQFQSKVQQRYPNTEFEFSIDDEEYDIECEISYYALSPAIAIQYSGDYGYVIHCKELL